MRSSNVKKVLLSVFLFLCILAVVLTSSFYLYYHTEMMYYRDGDLRKSLAGTIDCLVVGASFAMSGIEPKTLDEAMRVHSYNLSGMLVPMYARTMLAEKELARNPVKTVLIEVAFDAMLKNSADDHNQGDEPVIARLDSLSERIQYMRENLTPQECVNVFSRALNRCLQCWYNLAVGSGGVDYEARGFVPVDPIDLTIPEDDVAAYYHAQTFTLDGYREENIEQLKELVAVCRKYGAEPVIINLVNSDHDNWETDQLALYHDWIAAFAQEQGCRFYDFNLIKARYDLFNDADCFCDINHLSTDSARVFSRLMGEVLLRAEEGIDVSDEFYESFDAMMEDSPYTKMCRD